MCRLRARVTTFTERRELPCGGCSSFSLSSAGSAYAYASKSFGPSIEFLAGWALLLDYVLLLLVNYLVIGFYPNILFPVVPAWIFVVARILLATALNIVGIASAARASNNNVLIQFIFIVVFVAIAVAFISSRSHSIDLAAPFIGDGRKNITFSAVLYLFFSRV